MNRHLTFNALKRSWLFIAVIANWFSDEAREEYRLFTGKEFSRRLAFNLKTIAAIAVSLGTLSAFFFGSQWWLSPRDQQSAASVANSGNQASTPAGPQTPPSVQSLPTAQTTSQPTRQSKPQSAPGSTATPLEKPDDLANRPMLFKDDGILAREGVDVTVNVSTPPPARQIKDGFASYDSFYSGSPPGPPYRGFNPFEGGLWSNSQGGSAWAQYSLESTEKIGFIYIRLAGTDVSSFGSRIDVIIRKSQYHPWVLVFSMRDKVINRDFSGGSTGPRTGPVLIKLSGLEVSDIRIEMKGHGWFGLGDVRILDYRTPN
jgi:hypothetical protein